MLRTITPQQEERWRGTFSCPTGIGICAVIADQLVDYQKDTPP